MSFQKSIKRLALPFALVGLLSAGASSAMAQGLATAQPGGFQTTGSVIQGWAWLRSPGDSARWHFRGVRARPGQACINFNLLVTDGVNGGSGHGGRIRVIVTGDNGGRSETATLSLVNPFRPVFTGNTGGVGYQAYGAVCPRTLGTMGPGGFTIVMQWTPAVGRHIAVRQDGAMLAYVR
jgi:hypothetical protein